jgi:heme/copper-type cytochrome/quinol oxidase subunit 3
MAWASLKMNDFSKFRLHLGLTICCAGVPRGEVSSTPPLHEGEGPAQHVLRSTFTMTGLHGLHISAASS